MNEKFEIRTVLGKKSFAAGGSVLSHEHICCYSEQLLKMSDVYLDKGALCRKAVETLKAMKEKRGLGLFVDCTPCALGRDIELLKEVSRLSGVDIVCATGFYYDEDSILNCMSEETLADFAVEDAKRIGAGIIKAAVEHEELSDFNVKLLKAAAIAHGKTGLPIVLHTNANNRNGQSAVEILLNENVLPERIVVGHLSDTENADYIKGFANLGCYVALDRMYMKTSAEYIEKKVKTIMALCEGGYEKKVLLSHDDAIFQGFDAAPKIKDAHFDYMFEYIAPKLSEGVFERIVKINPLEMLSGNERGI